MIIAANIDIYTPFIHLKHEWRLWPKGRRGYAITESTAFRAGGYAAVRPATTELPEFKPFALLKAFVRYSVTLSGLLGQHANEPEHYCLASRAISEASIPWQTLGKLPNKLSARSSRLHQLDM
jgi:hypothetical protein